MGPIQTLKCQTGQTAWMWAAVEGNAQAVEMLIEGELIPASGNNGFKVGLLYWHEMAGPKLLVSC